MTPKPSRKSYSNHSTAVFQKDCVRIHFIVLLQLSVLESSSKFQYALVHAIRQDGMAKGRGKQQFGFSPTVCLVKQIHSVLFHPCCRGAMAQYINPPPGRLKAHNLARRLQRSKRSRYQKDRLERTQIL